MEEACPKKVVDVTWLRKLFYGEMNANSSSPCEVFEG